MSYLNLWRYLRDQRKGNCRAARFAVCREEYLHHLGSGRQDLVGNCAASRPGSGLRVGRKAAAEAADERVHAALVAGLLSHVGIREGDSRTTPGRNAKFVLAPGSVLTRRPPRWVVVSDLVETSRLYGRTAARIEPETVERVAGHLVVRTYSEPHWDPQRRCCSGLRAG